MTPGQLKERKLGIGGSDVASLFNTGYGCRRALWYDKTDTPADFPFKGNRMTEMGTALEDLVANWYVEETGRTVFKLGRPLVSPDSYLRVNVDRIVCKEAVDPDLTFAARHGAPLSILPDPGVQEIKSVGRGVFYKIKREGLPNDYILQLQAGMVDFPEIQWGAFAVGCRDNGELLHWDVPRSEAVCTEIRAEVPVFWALVENGPAPDRLEPDDRRCQTCQWRTTCQGDALVSIAPSSEYEVDDSLAPLVQEYIDRRALAKEADELLDETKEELKSRLGARGMVSAAGAKVQYYSIEKKAYSVPARTERALRVYPRKEGK